MTARVGLVALDVDGTVLTPDHLVAPSTAAAVAAARRRGVRIVLASSRGPVALAAVQEALDLRDEWFIGYQGALVARRTGSALQVLAEQPMDPRDAQAVEDRAAALGLSVGRYVGTRWRVPVVTEAIRLEASLTGETPVPGTPQERAADGPPHAVLVIAAALSEVAALDELARDLPPGVSGTFSHRTFLEVTAAGVDKASGLRPLLEHLGVPARQAAAVGDGDNDLALFAAVGHPVAMGQAPDRVQAAAAWVTGRNRDDGVAQALDRLCASRAGG